MNYVIDTFPLPSVSTLQKLSVIMAVILAGTLAYIWHRINDPNIVSKTTAWGAGTIYTVRHDGHLWIVRASSRISPVHHPDCPCQK